MTFGDSDKAHNFPRMTFGDSDNARIFREMTFGDSDKAHNFCEMTFGDSDKARIFCEMTIGDSDKAHNFSRMTIGDSDNARIFCEMTFGDSDNAHNFPRMTIRDMIYAPVFFNMAIGYIPKRTIFPQMTIWDVPGHGVFPRRQLIGILFTFAAMVSKSFDIHTAHLPPFEAGTKRLLLEISPEMVSVILWDKASQAIEGVEMFTGYHGESDDWRAMVQQSRLLGFTDIETLVLIANPEMIPIPGSLYNPLTAKAQLELFFGARPAMFLGGDIIAAQQIVTAWLLPEKIHQFLTGHFQVIQFRHIVSGLMEHQISDNMAEGLIAVYGNMAWVLLWKSGSFMIAKPVAFSQPDDLSWHLLEVCRHFKLEPSPVHWKVTGMVKEESPLWQSIIRFLEKVSALESGIKVPDGLPEHYYAHLQPAF